MTTLKQVNDFLKKHKIYGRLTYPTPPRLHPIKVELVIDDAFKCIRLSVTIPKSKKVRKK